MLEIGSLYSVECEELGVFPVNKPHDLRSLVLLEQNELLLIVDYKELEHDAHFTALYKDQVVVRTTRITPSINNFDRWLKKVQ